jgi:dephospho-CoA kinase
LGRFLRIGLTGGIASGKSTVAALFAGLGVPVIDTDEIAREVVLPGSAGLAEVVAAFGPAVLDPAGALDRRRLRSLVFADDGARRRLEAITHPRIEAATLAACDRAGGPYQLLVVPLLFESGFARHVDRILVVDCEAAIQRDRLLRRDGEEPAQVERILRAQLDPATRRARADDVIRNDGDREQLREQVQKLHERYVALGHAARTSGPGR